MGTVDGSSVGSSDDVLQESESCSTVPTSVPHKQMASANANVEPLKRQRLRPRLDALSSRLLSAPRESHADNLQSNRQFLSLWARAHTYF